jgi:hypothetical protein
MGVVDGLEVSSFPASSIVTVASGRNLLNRDAMTEPAILRPIIRKSDVMYWYEFGEIVAKAFVSVFKRI